MWLSFGDDNRSRAEIVGPLYPALYPRRRHHICPHPTHRNVWVTARKSKPLSRATNTGSHSNAHRLVHAHPHILCMGSHPCLWVSSMPPWPNVDTRMTIPPECWYRLHATPGSFHLSPYCPTVHEICLHTLTMGPSMPTMSRPPPPVPMRYGRISPSTLSTFSAVSSRPVCSSMICSTSKISCGHLQISILRQTIGGGGGGRHSLPLSTWDAVIL